MGEGYALGRVLRFGLIGCGGLIALVVVLSIAGALLGGGGGGGEPADEAQTPAEQKIDSKREARQDNAAEKPDPTEDQGGGDEAKVYAIGEPVTVGDFTYTVTNAQRVDRLEDPTGLQEPMTGSFVVVDFTFANNGDDPATVSDSGMYVYDDQGRQFETDADAALYLPQDKSIFILDRVNPGLTQDVETVYSVPPDATGLQLEVTSGFFASESARIALGF
jgi:hypothetical protein